MEGAGFGIMRSKRDHPPSHYSLTIESFSLLAKTKGDKYESEIFEAEGYNWRLCLYPNGNRNNNGKDHLSLYVAIEDGNTFPRNWAVNVDLKLFIFDHITNKFLSVHDGTVKRFHEMKTEWGFPQFLPLRTFNNESNGYLVDDCCIFGVEVFVIEPNCMWESLSIIEKPKGGYFGWKIEDFSKLDDSVYSSKVFTAAERNWRLNVYPKGCSNGKGNSLSIFLQLVNGNELPTEKKLWVEHKLRLVNQQQNKNVEQTVEQWYNSTYHSWGYTKFIPLGYLQDSRNGFIVNDALIVEVEILILSETIIFC